MIIIGVIFLVVATVFVLENRDVVTVHFLGWSFPVALGVALLVAAVGGAAVIYLSGLVKQTQLRAQARAAEARVRDLERDRRNVLGRPDADEDVPE